MGFRNMQEKLEKKYMLVFSEFNARAHIKAVVQSCHLQLLVTSSIKISQLADNIATTHD